MATSRVLAHESIAADVLQRLADKARNIVVGNPMNGHIGLGPLINERQLQRVHGIVQDTVAAGATVAAGGTYERLFYKPTVLAGVKPGMRAFDEEIFGPVCSVIPFASDADAIRLANDTEYGLSAAIVSRSPNRAPSRWVIG